MPNQPTQQDSLIAKERSGAIVAAISREVVGIYAEYHGRGPTKAKTIWRDGIVVCTLEEVFTRAESILIDAGRFDQVSSHRQTIREITEPRLRAAVQEQTGRRVETCLGQIHADDVAVEVFLLGEHLPAALP
jgi:uncharacterized protein YbcI